MKRDGARRYALSKLATVAALVVAGCSTHTTIIEGPATADDGGAAGGPGSGGDGGAPGDCDATASCEDDPHLVVHYLLDGDARDDATGGAETCTVSGAVAAADRFGGEGRALHFDPSRSARVVCSDMDGPSIQATSIQMRVGGSVRNRFHDFFRARFGDALAGRECAQSIDAATARQGHKPGERSTAIFVEIVCFAPDLQEHFLEDVFRFLAVV